MRGSSRPIPPRRKTGSERLRLATDPRSDGSDPSRIRAPPRGARRPRRRRGSDTRSLLQELGHAASHPPPPSPRLEVPSSESPTPSSQLSVTTEPPALHSVPLNS